MGLKDVCVRNGDKLPIQEFKLSCMTGHPSIVMIAKRGSGKSWVVRAILHHFSDIPAGIIIAPTDRMNSFYGRFFPDTFIYYDYKSEIIERILRRQEEMIDREEEKKKIGKKLDSRAFIVMDDCLAKRGSWVRDGPILELLFNGRHYHIMYILTMQVPLGITPELRSNFDYIFLLADDYISNMKKIYDHYAGMFPDFNSFRQVFTQLTEDFGSMVIANKGARSNFLEKIFWYKAPNFEGSSKTFGCRQFNKYHEMNYDKNWKKTHKPLDINAYCLNKKQSKATVMIDKVNADKLESENTRTKKNH